MTHLVELFVRPHLHLELLAAAAALLCLGPVIDTSFAQVHRIQLDADGLFQLTDASLEEFGKDAAELDLHPEQVSLRDAEHLAWTLLR